MGQALKEHAITFFTLLAEANKLDIYSKKWDLTASSYPTLDEDDQQSIRDNLQLPDDLLSDILESETPDGINILKEALEDGE